MPQDDGVVRSSVPIEGLSTSKSVNDLPDYYTDVPPVSVGVKGSPVPAGTPVSLQRKDYKSHKEEENRWLKNVYETLLDPEIEAPKNISWAAYHANRYQKKDLIVSPSALLPLFHENAHSVAMIHYSMNLIKNAVDHINSGQIPVIAFDQPLYTIAKQIQSKWPEMYGEEKFVIMLGGLHFTAQKTVRPFSAIALDKAHKKVNACIKGDGGAVGLTDDSNALQCWMVAGPEVARAIGEFQDAMEPVNSENTEESKHHEENRSWQKLFVKDVRSLISTIKELGNPFEEDSNELLALDTTQIADVSVVQTVESAYKIGKHQFDLFVKERLMERKVPLDEVLSRNKLALFSTKHVPEKKGKQQLMSMKSDMQLFSRLYIACQTRDGNLDEFFHHENQSCPPSLSDMGNLRLGGKSDLLACLENLSAAKSEAPAVTDITLDAPA